MKLMQLIINEEKMCNMYKDNAKEYVHKHRYYSLVDPGSSNFLANSEKIFRHSEYRDRQKRMSWKTINAILALAVTDEKFCQELLLSPLLTIQARNFELSEQEQEKLRHIVAMDLSEFSQQMLNVFGREDS